MSSLLDVFLLYISGRYSNKNISFGIVDIGHFPNAAEKFGISLPGNDFWMLYQIFFYDQLVSLTPTRTLSSYALLEQ